MLAAVLMGKSSRTLVDESNKKLVHSRLSDIRLAIQNADTLTGEQVELV